ncbi:OmpA family protein [Brevundimonas lenta]|uniref:Outer membrane protein OmpA-like peptidoglycan-associated protein n=1 Tax=Brevundimonas lenta TaxID=424796 RepID=A0A7W6JBK1_9CAUL|nr:OmpA family protein [Brevundimonas lenta]MBB4082074.1 outer membrane protein OmpA-like peptidoglycan-associated protein [Brevundimonas lenta]
MTRSTFKKAALTGVALAAGLAMSGCATESYVNEQVAMVDSRVSAVDARVTQVEGTAGQALQRANDAHKLAEGKFLYEVVLSDDSVKFPNDVHALSPEAEARLAELAQRLRTENRNVYLEIQGHTDSVGSAAHNEQLGESRAEAVRRSLSRQGVALNRMATISYGEDAPIAPNETAEGRAQNRRVAIIVLT